MDASTARAGGSLKPLRPGDAMAAVRDALRSHGVSDAAVERSQLGLRSSWTYGSERQFPGYEREATFAMESTWWCRRR